jgi:hypothetical protein
MEDLLPWFRSFDGVSEQVCPSVESLRDCHVFGLIFNQLQEKQVDMASLPRTSATDTWVAYLRNIRTLTEAMKPVLEAHKLSLAINQTAFARNSNPEALANLVELFIRLSLKVPRKAEEAARIKQMPKATQLAIKALFDKTAKPPDADSPPRAEAGLAQAQAERARLQQEQADLERERGELLAARAGPRAAELHEIEGQRERILRRGAELDAEIQRREGVAEEKRRLQGEVDALGARARELAAQLGQAPKTVDDFRRDGDERARRLLADIDDAERRLRPEYADALRQAADRLRRTIQQLTKEEKELAQMVGDMPDVGADEATRAMSEDIQALLDSNNRLNEETVRLVARAEAIEKLRSQQSFLEHLRSSKRFVRPE